MLLLELRADDPQIFNNGICDPPFPIPLKAGNKSLMGKVHSLHLKILPEMGDLG